MAKFSGPSVRPGEGPAAIQDAAPPAATTKGDPLLTEIIAQQQAEVSGQPATTEVTELQAPTPQAPAPQVQAPTQAETQAAYDQQVQRERERVPTIKERQAAEAAPITRWQESTGVKPVEPGVKVDGGLMARARKMSESFMSGEARLPTNVNVAPIAQTFSNIGALKEEVNAEGVAKPTLDPRFAAISSLIVENSLAELSSGSGVDVDPFTGIATVDGEKVLDFESEPGSAEFTKEAGNVRLGKEIAREWMRYKNAEEGRPSDEYEDIPAPEAAMLGDAFKAVWAQQNPQLMKRYNTPSGKTVYQLTPQGVDDITMGSQERKKLFPKQNIRPSKVKPEKGKLLGESRKLVRDVSGQVGRQGGRQIHEEAMENLSTVANVVDMQRSRIGLATILPALGAQVDLDPTVVDVFADIHSIGPDKLAAFTATFETAQAKDQPADPPTEAMRKYKNNIAQQVFGVAQERKGVNYLSYYLQAFNGRIAPQQSIFDPTSGKYTRFVTRNAIPAIAKPGNRVDNNLQQMYAMMLVKDADVLLPKERVRALAAATPQLKQWGRRMKELLDNSVSEADAEAIQAAIEQGMSVTDPNFPQVKPLALDPQQDADLIKAIHKKGEDGPHFIDGLIDFHDWHEAVRVKGQPYHSYFNAYIDGKTNGIASNGLQMGSESVARATGVIRKSQTNLLDEGDIRDQLKDNLIESIQTNGWHGLEDKQASDAMYYVAETVYGIRNLNKKTTMTFAYGKDIDSFGTEISEFMALEMQTDPQLRANVDLLTAGGVDVVDTLLQQYKLSLEQVLSDEALRARNIMKTTALMAGLFDVPLSIKAYGGYQLNFGGEQALPFETAEKRSYSHFEGGADNETQHREYIYDRQTKPTAAFSPGAFPETIQTSGGGEFTLANRQEVGKKAQGGSIPGPVQSLDAITVAMTASGKSWEKLKQASNGAPYLHTIYDAFKMDANGYDVVLEEVNKNWLQAGLEWSYLKEMRKFMKRNIKDFKDKYDAMSEEEKNTPQDTTGVGHPFMMAAEMYFRRPNMAGEMKQGRLWGFLFKNHPGLKKGMNEQQRMDVVSESVQRINDVMGGAPQAFTAENLTPKQVFMFIDALLKETRLMSQLDDMIEITENNKKKLRKKLEAEGPVYQYYAH